MALNIVQQRLKNTVPVNSAKPRSLLIRATELFCSLAIIFLIVWPKYAYFGGSIKFNPFTAATFAALVLIVASLVVDKGFFQRMFVLITSRKSIAVAIAIWCAVRFVADLYGGSPGSLPMTVHDITNQGVFFLITMVVVSSPNGLSKLLNIFVGATAIVTTIALYEYVSGTFFVSNFWGLFSLDAEFIRTRSAALNMMNGVIRVRSVSTHPIVLAQYSASVAPLMLALSFEAKKLSRTLFYFVMAGLCVFTVFVAQSRSGLLALILAIGVFSFLYVWHLAKTHRGEILAISLLIVIAVVVVFSSSFADMVSGRNADEMSSTLARTAMWDKSAPMIWKSWVLGYGDGQCLVLGGYTFSSGIVTVDDSVLCTLVNFGVAGLLSFVFLAIMIAWNIYKSLLHCDRKLVGLYSSLFSMSVAIVFVQKVISIPDNIVFLYVVGGICCAIICDERTVKNPVWPGGFGLRSSSGQR